MAGDGKKDGNSASRGGRPSKLTPDVRGRIAQAVKLGATYEHAALYGGVSYDTFNRWMQRGATQRRGEFRQFYDAVKAAEGEAVLVWLAKIERAASESWHAAAWKLERRYPAAYGRQLLQHEVTGKDGGKIEHAHEHAATVTLYMPDNGRDPKQAA